MTSHPGYPAPTRIGRRLAVTATALLLAGGTGLAAPAEARAVARPPVREQSELSAKPGPTDPIADAITKAQATGQPVTVTSQTDESSTLVANPDGTVTREASSMPQRVQHDGAWTPIDTTLTHHTDGSYTPAAAVTSVSFSGGGTAAMATLRAGVDALSFQWPTALPTPTTSGDTATYADVLPDVDLQLTADASGYSSILIIKTAEAATNPALQQIVLGTTATHLDVTATPDGGAQAVDTSTGATVFHSDTALMWDSTPATTSTSPPSPAAGTLKTPQTEHAAAARLGAHHAQVQVGVAPGRQTLTLDKALLTASSTTFPVFVDPEWSGSPGKSQLNWGRISSNGWNVYNSTATTGAANPRAGYDDWPEDGGAGERARTYYAMNTAGIKGAIVTKADLYVNEFWAAGCTDTAAAVYGTGAVSSWSSSGLYWGHEPSRQTGVLATASSHQANCGTSSAHVTPPTLDFNITGRISAAATGNIPYATLLVEANDMNDKNAWKQFSYGGGATLSVTYTYRPKLKDGTGDPAIHPSVANMGKTMTTTHTPTLSARAIDPDLAGGSEPLHILYRVYNASGAQVGSDGYGPASGFNANGSDWTTPSLPDGTYTWKATAQNSSGYWVSPSMTWTATQTFTVDTSAPHAPSVSSTDFPPNQIGASYDDTGGFTLGNDRTNNVVGYLFSLDGNLADTDYGQNHGTDWGIGGPVTPGTIYYAMANNGAGPLSVNGTAGVTFAPGTAGAHTLYAKAVDQAGSTSPQTSYTFYAGTSNATFAAGDMMVAGFSLTNTDGSTTTIPAATTTSTGGILVRQTAASGVTLYDGYQGLLANNGTTKVANGDSATFSFGIPAAGSWDIGADLTTGPDYGTYSLTLDAGKPNATTLINAFDAYSGHADARYLDFGTPKNAGGALQTLSQGVHTVTVTLTGTNTASTGYQAGIDVLRLAPTLTCSIDNTAACQNNTAISTYTAGTPAKTTPANADGTGYSLNAADLTAADWTPGSSVTVDGAAIKLPTAFGTGATDNMLASGQIITVPATGVVNQGNALVFLAFATNTTTKHATGTITYGDDGCVSSQLYTIDAVTDWTAGTAGSTVLTLPHRNKNDGTQSTTNPALSLFAVSIPLTCPGATVTSISLPLVSNGVQAGQSAIHILGLGIRPSSATNSGPGTPHWVGSWAAATDTGAVQAQPDGGDPVTATLTNQTVRIPVHLSIGTDPSNQIRIHLSNALATIPATIDAASVALQDTTAGGATAATTPTALTFHSSRSATLPAGTDLTSDPITLTANQQSTLLVSLKIHGSPPSVAGHLDAQTPIYLSAADNTDHTLDTTAANFSASALTGIPYLSAVDVSTPTDQPTGSLVLYGDQTINSDTGNADGMSHVSDYIATDLGIDDGDGTVPYGILNEGSGSWGHQFLLPAVGNSPNPQNATGLPDRDILSQANVRTALISAGSDDLLTCTGTADSCATTVDSKLTAFASQLRAYYTDDSTNYNVSIGNLVGTITVYVATLPPFLVSHTATQEAARQLVNAYILDSTDQLYLNGAADGAIDFAAAVSKDKTDTSPTVNPDDTYTDGINTYPADTYYQDLAWRYVIDTEPSDGNVGTQPNIAGAMVASQNTNN